MTVEELLCYGKQYIHSDLSKMLLSEILNKNPLELLNYLNEQVNEVQEIKYKKSIEALKTGKPIQYVLGNVNFYGIKYYINENVLIPRFETEELVENTIKYVNKFFTEPVDIIDLGCGSGVIGLTLENKLSTKSVDLVDISEKALQVANINKQNLKSKSTLIESDMFDKITKKYDVIISNPPYIKTTEEIETIVKDNEPNIALYAGEDGLDYYKKILSNIKEHMNNRCLIAFEIGMTQANSIKKLIIEELGNVEVIIKKDLSEKDRMIFVLYNLE